MASVAFMECTKRGDKRWCHQTDDVQFILLTFTLGRPVTRPYTVLTFLGGIMITLMNGSLISNLENKTTRHSLQTPVQLTFIKLKPTVKKVGYLDTRIYDKFYKLVMNLVGLVAY